MAAVMDTSTLNDLKGRFESALQVWILKIQRLQEILRTTTHSARSEDIWEQADLDLTDAEDAVRKARQDYEEAVRKANFGF
jgi:hypothetical protein